jgi:serine/threonine protein kinase/tetratricopeptide (TPR) repeat protein
MEDPAAPEQRWKRIWDLFHEAAERPPEDRAAYLDSASAGDSDLRREVEELLEAHDNRPGFLHSSDRRADWALSSDHAAGDRIGPYEIRSVIGEGGMGVVYEAEQSAPIRRRVALKLIRLGMDTREVVARFESERQALALMSHPHIAHVFDGGATDEGRPYFVMELVPGVPITEYADAKGLTTRERIELFLPVCRAIQHAHQKGIVHRDIKPPNVLVKEEEGRPVPKVIDFGVAKAIEEPLTQRSLHTQQGRILGTPEYMSPEQAEMGRDIDTRTDIYSLGILLYELLTGRPPFEFGNASYGEIQRRIRAEDPPRPSSRAGAQGADSRSIAARRGADAPALRRELRGDLDAIVMKALEKQRSQRYATASELAADLERAMRHEPVTAGPHGAAYRLNKFVRRHKVGVAAVAAIAVLLTGLAVTMAVQSARISRALDRADREREKAQRVSAFLVDLFRVSDPGEGGGNLPAREILDRGSARIAAELRAEPEVQAALMETMGRVYRNLGLYPKAASLHESALALRRTTMGDTGREVARGIYELGVSLQARGEIDRAETLIRDALARQRALLGEDHLETADSLNQLGSIRHARDDFSDAVAQYEAALAVRRKLLDPADPLIAQSVRGLGSALQATGDFEGAERLLRDSLATNLRVLGPEHLQTIASQFSLAALLNRKGDKPAAERSHREVLAARRRVLGARHPTVAESLNSLAALLYERGDNAGAEAASREALAIQREALGPTHPRVTQTINNLALAVQERGDFASAESLYREALDTNRKLYGEEHTLVAGNWNNLGLMFYEKGDLAAAEPLFRRTYAILSKKLGEEHPDLGFSLNNLARTLHDRGDLAAAEPYYRRGLALRRKKLPAGHVEIAASLTGLGRLLTDRGNPRDGEPLLREALAIRRKGLTPGNWRIDETESCLGASLAAQGRRAEAEPLLTRSYQALREKRGDRDPRTRQALQRLTAFNRGAGSRGRAMPSPPSTGG